MMVSRGPPPPSRHKVFFPFLRCTLHEWLRACEWKNYLTPKALLLDGSQANSGYVRAGKGGCCGTAAPTHNIITSHLLACKLLPQAAAYLVICNSSSRPSHSAGGSGEAEAAGARRARGLGWAVCCSMQTFNRYEVAVATRAADGSIQMQRTGLRDDASLQLNGSWVSLLPHAAGSPYCVIPGCVFA